MHVKTWKLFEKRLTRLCSLGEHLIFNTFVCVFRGAHPPTRTPPDDSIVDPR